MEFITYRITLDAMKSGIQRVLQGFKTEDILSRRISINLTSNGDVYEIPQNNVSALMYINMDGTSYIDECRIVDNTIEYDVRPLLEGEVSMQLKLIETSPSGAKKVLMAPVFSVEVIDEGFDDSAAESSPQFSALENATARANAVYDSRLLRVEFDNNGTVNVYYADGTVYTNTRFGELFQQTMDASASAVESKEVVLASLSKAEEWANISEGWANVSKGFSEEANASKNQAEVNAQKTEADVQNAQIILDDVLMHSVSTNMRLNEDTGELEYESTAYEFEVDMASGCLMWKSVIDESRIRRV